MSDPILPQNATLSDELRDRIQSRLKLMKEQNWIARIWDGEAQLWKSEPPHMEVIERSLGWLKLPTRMLPKVGMLEGIAGDLRKDFDRLVLLGMGGSSLAPWCFSEICGSRDGYPELHLLDSTVPEDVLQATKGVSPDRCLFLVASKSGTTTETRALFDYFWGEMSDRTEDEVGERFVIITDPDSALVQAATERGIPRVFENWEDIGGRYSALSYFGMVPAALIGAPFDAMLESGSEMAGACSPEVPARENPGAALGALLGCCYEIGRDKVTLLTSERLASFGDWIEQLLAESTGKESKGLVPVVNEPPLAPDAYSDDRVFAYLRYGEDRTHDQLADAVAALGHPVMRIDVAEPCRIGGEMFRWEFATAVAGALMGINPFDQPNVQESKDRTREVLDQYAETGELPEQEPDVAETALFSEDVRGVVQDLIEGIRPRDYFAIMTYLPRSEMVDEAVARMRTAVSSNRRVATTAGYGPRFLHSTGQLHKGGPNTGVFLQITSEGGARVDVPNAPYDFATLKDGQAAGDLAVLQARGRRVIRVDLGDDIPGNIGRLTEMIAGAF